MRVAIANWSRRKVGGAEVYLSRIIPELHRLGHAVGFWHELNLTTGEEIGLAPEMPVWSMADLGVERALESLREWAPDLVYVHGLTDPGVEAELISIAPSILFGHNYYGTCLTGAKTVRKPALQPCNRRFGLACLVRYYPHRCGGLNPVTMVQLFRTNWARLGLLPRYDLVLTASEPLQAEYVNHGVAPERVRTVRLPVASGGAERAPVPHHTASAELRLLFAGRMESLKGGALLLDAAPRIRSSLGRPVRVTLSGDGPDRERWAQHALRLQSQHEGITFDFTGWIDREGLLDHLDDTDVVAVPSIWPEPFGMIGPEAGLRGVPAVAFSVGGITEWLHDGVNGHLAPGDPPTAEGLARAVVQCVQDPAHHARLREGARTAAQRFDMESHMAGLLDAFESVLARGTKSLGRSQSATVDG